jgi:Helix-turn-helix domain
MNEKPTNRYIRRAATAAAGKGEAERLTYDVPEAGRLIGLGRNAAYSAAKAGLLPVIRIGKREFVPKAALQRMLEG